MSSSRRLSCNEKEHRRRLRWLTRSGRRSFEADSRAYLTRRTIQLLCKDDPLSPKSTALTLSPQPFICNSNCSAIEDVCVDVEQCSSLGRNSALEFQKCWNIAGWRVHPSALLATQQLPLSDGSASLSPHSPVESKVLDVFTISISFASDASGNQDTSASHRAPANRSPRTVCSVQPDLDHRIEDNDGKEAASSGSSILYPVENALLKRRKVPYPSVDFSSESPGQLVATTPVALSPRSSMESSALKLACNETLDDKTLQKMKTFLASFKEEIAAKDAKLEHKPCDFGKNPILSQKAMSPGVNSSKTIAVKKLPVALEDACVPKSRETNEQLKFLAEHPPLMPNLEKARATGDGVGTKSNAANLFQNLNKWSINRNDAVETDHKVGLAANVEKPPKYKHTRTRRVARNFTAPVDSRFCDAFDRKHQSSDGSQSPEHDVNVVKPQMSTSLRSERKDGNSNPVHELLGNCQFRKTINQVESCNAEPALNSTLHDTRTCLDTENDKAKGGHFFHELLGNRQILGGLARSTEPSNNCNPPFSHALFAQQAGNKNPINLDSNVKRIETVSNECYENVVWIPHDPSEIALKNIEIELAWLCEESMYCLNQNDVSWEFVWEYASPSLKVEMRKLQRNDVCKLRELIRLDDPLVARRFEIKRNEIRSSLRGGFRRPVMSHVIAEMRLRGRQGKLNLGQRPAKNPPSQLVAVEQPKKKRRKKGDTKVLFTPPQKSATVPLLSAIEEEICWLGEESFLLDPRQECFNTEFVRQHASPVLRRLLETTLSSEAHRRWLPRLVRLHDPYVKMEFERQREEIRERLRAGFRRPQTKDFLPLIEPPLPIQVRVRESFLAAFRNQPLSSSELARASRK